MKKQANSRFCFVCGVDNPSGLHVSFYTLEPGVVSTQCQICEKHQGYPGVVHGGVVAAILDEVAGRTFMDGEPPRFLVTARLSVRYRRPVPVGQPLKAIGRAIEDGGKVAKASGQLFDKNGVLLAEAEVILAQIPQEFTTSMQESGEEWRVYPDEELKE